MCGRRSPAVLRSGGASVPRIFPATRPSTLPRARAVPLEHIGLVGLNSTLRDMLSFEVSDWLAPTVPSQQLVLLASVALATCYFTYSVWFHPLASVPGPLQARLGLGYVTTRTYKRDVGWTLHELHQHYGPIVRVGRNLVSIADPEAIPLM